MVKVRHCPPGQALLVVNHMEAWRYGCGMTKPKRRGVFGIWGCLPNKDIMVLSEDRRTFTTLVDGASNTLLLHIPCKACPVLACSFCFDFGYAYLLLTAFDMVNHASPFTNINHLASDVIHRRIWRVVVTTISWGSGRLKLSLMVQSLTGSDGGVLKR
jgi:hypothetical protein